MGADIKAALNIPDAGYSENMGAMDVKAKIRHYDLYITDGFINTASGAWPAPADNTVIAGWTQNTVQTPAPKYAGPVYVWGFTDVDPNISGNLMTVPPGAYTESPPYDIIGKEVGNAKFPAPFLDCYMGEHVFITVHNRGFFQRFQQQDVGAVQDDHTLHLHGIHAQTPYDGFPESAGTYIEQLRYFWLEPWYTSLGNTVSPSTTTTRQRDNWWNSLTLGQQQNWLKKNTPLKKDNFQDNGGAILSQFSNMPWPMGVEYALPGGYDGNGLLSGTWKNTNRDNARYPGTEYTVEEATQFTYYFTPMHIGTYMYHCHMLAAEHVQMGMYGALVVRPADYSPTNKTAYGRGTKTEYDVENTIIVSEFDPRWHRLIESFGRSTDLDITSFKMADWKPELWFVNGRTFPQSILDFKWNPPVGFAPTPGQDNPYVEPRYNTLIAVKSNKKFLTRWINMGYQEHPMHQHGWHMCIVGKDAMLKKDCQDVYTVLLGSGETYDTITLANPVYGVTDPAGSPLSSASDHFINPSTGAITPMTKPTLQWRQIYPVHDHDDYRVTTNDIYPGGGLVLIVVTDVPNTPPGTPTWMDPYTGIVESLP